KGHSRAASWCVKSRLQGRIELSTCHHILHALEIGIQPLGELGSLLWMLGILENDCGRTAPVARNILACAPLRHRRDFPLASSFRSIRENGVGSPDRRNPGGISAILQIIVPALCKIRIGIY